MPNRGYQNSKYKSKPTGLYKARSGPEYSCARCAYRQKFYCDLRKVKLDAFLLSSQRCRDFMSESKSVDRYADND